jgi:hypothetical protein
LKSISEPTGRERFGRMVIAINAAATPIADDATKSHPCDQLAREPPAEPISCVSASSEFSHDR